MAIDVVAIARDNQTVRAELLQERLEAALEALIRDRLGGTTGDMAALRCVLFDLYDEGILTKAEVRRRGRIGPAEFHDQLRKHRLGATTTRE